ncbi:Uncharacterised protein [Klebsiella pneumoniae]|nr:hypothetical protein SM87_05862 [Klebsiella pneumoniae]SAT36239.1 Uncharacterised protein [Klebsiella pneumoniae]SAX07365.1 Uncharacterised protein [Klebsiella pneumoniae]VGC73489.1 Uncharacterised protein [Klebsiella pneumoniae]VGD28865.1 Uncharacterised protein [Klebsiella pneumoniae]
MIINFKLKTILNESPLWLKIIFSDAKKTNAIDGD